MSSPVSPSFHHSLLPSTRPTSFISFICWPPCIHMSLQIFWISVFQERWCTPFNNASHVRTRGRDRGDGTVSQEHQGYMQLPEARKRQRKVLLRASEGAWPYWQILNVSPSGSCETIRFCCFKLSCLPHPPLLPSSVCDSYNIHRKLIHSINKFECSFCEMSK